MNSLRGIRYVMMTSVGLFLLGSVQAVRAQTLDKALLDASKKCQVEKVRDLLRRGASVNARDRNGRSVIILAWGTKPDLTDNCNSTVIELLKANVPVSDAQGHLANYVLVWALENGRSEQLASMVSKGVTAENHWGEHALKRALNEGNEPLTRLLLSHKAPIPFHAVALAAKSGNTKLVSDLVDAGAKIDGFEKVEVVFISGNTIRCTQGAGSDGLMYAIAGGYVEIVRILLASGTKPFKSPSFMVYEEGRCIPLPPRPHIYATHMDLAAALGQVETVKLLLDKSVMNAETLTTPLIAGCIGGHADVVRVLLAKVTGAQRDLALMALRDYIDERLKLAGFEGYRKESQLLAFAQLAQTAEAKALLVLHILTPKLERNDLLERAKTKGVLATLQLLEGSGDRAR